MTVAPDSFLGRCRHWLWNYEPIRNQRWEIIILRLILVLLVWDMHSLWSGSIDDPAKALRLIFFKSPDINVLETSQPLPTGLAHFFDFTFISNDTVEAWAHWLTAGSLILYLAGVPGAFSLFIPLVVNVSIATLRLSQGNMGHNAQVVGLALLAAWVAGVVSLIQKYRGRALPEGMTGPQLEMDYVRQAIAAAYVVSAITKLWRSHGMWVFDTRYLPVQMVKSNEQEFYNKLDPATRHLDWLPQVLMNHPALCVLVFGLALPLELFAFVGLRNRRIAMLIGLGLISFHQSVSQLMALTFFYNKLLLLAFFVGPWWWVAKMVNKGEMTKVGDQ